jgi:hypothetical protein
MRRLLPVTSLAVLLAVHCASAVGAAPSDPSAAGQEPLKIMRVGEALDHVGPALSDITVLTADTGLALQHPDIAPRLFAMPQDTPAPDPDGTGNPGTVMAGKPGWDLLGTDGPPALMPDADPSDSAPDGGHGTNVAGILGAAWNHGQGGAGVAPNARFLALRTCWGNDQCYEYVQASAFNWAADRGVRVVSMSWLSGTPIENDLAAAITSHPNVLFVAIPSGNGGACDADGQPGAPGTCGDVDANTPPMPCALNAPNVVCVTTATPSDGLDCGAYGHNSVDVAVPTQNNVTTTRDGGYTPTGCATSFAAPTLAGLATILFGIDPTASAADVRAAIVDSARKVPAFDGKSVSGGIADALAAVDLFQSRRGIPGRTPPVTNTQTPASTPGPSGSAPGPAPAAADTTLPVLKLKASLRRRLLRITLSEDATVRIACKRVGARRNAASLVRKLKTGTTRVTFPRKRLRPGRYRLTVTATDAAGNRSVPVRTTLRA